MYVHTLLAFLLVLILGACSVGPDYKPPALDAPAGWAERGAGRVAVSPTSPWWHEFHDPTLDDLIAKATANNLDVARAKAIVEEARAAIAQAKAGGVPQLTLSASRQSYQSYTTGGFDASWEIDLWGKTRRSVEAAQANKAAADANLDDARLTLLGDVARTYIQIRGGQALLASTKASVATRKRALEASKLRLSGGDGTGLEVLQAEGAVLDSETSLANQDANIRVSLHALAMLCGVAPAELGALQGESGRIPTAAAPTMGIPADLVRRRPDVRTAERQYAQSVAQIGVAVADKYPHLTITGNLNLGPGSIDGVMSQPLLSLLPSVSIPIFDAGKNATEQAARAKAEEQRLVYRAAVLAALKEVEDAMARLDGQQQTAQSARKLVASTTKQVDMARKTFLAGGDSYITVIDAERTVDSARQQLIQAEVDEAVQTVALYKALAGGWDVHGG